MKKLALATLAAVFMTVLAISPASACPMNGKGAMTKEQCAMSGMDCMKNKTKEEKTNSKEKDNTKEIPQKTKKEIKT